MSDLAIKIRAALGAVPIRSLTDSELRRELAALQALRKNLVPPVEIKAVPPTSPAPTKASPRAFKRIPLSKGSIFSRRVPVPENTWPVAEATPVQKVTGQSHPYAVQRLLLERAAALAAGLEAEFYQTFILRVQLLEAETAARYRRKEHSTEKPGRATAELRGR